MCNETGLSFGLQHLTSASIAGRSVLEVGARQVQQPWISLRPHVEVLRPGQYVGVDIAAGAGVDIVCPAEQLVDRFGAQSFDVVLCTEMLEHVEDWRTVISNLKRVLRPGGILLLTTRSVGFPYHAWPHDHWRFQLEDMRELFADCENVVLQDDAKEPGIFVLARRPEVWTERTPALAIHSVVTGRRRLDIPRVRTFLFTSWIGMRRRYVAAVPLPVRRFVNRLLLRRPA